MRSMRLANKICATEPLCGTMSVRHGGGATLLHFVSSDVSGYGRLRTVTCIIIGPVAVLGAEFLEATPMAVSLLRKFPVKTLRIDN